MHLAKKVKGYFVVWTTKDFVVLEIQWDDTWGANIKELKDCYLIHLQPKIIVGELYFFFLVFNVVVSYLF